MASRHLLVIADSILGALWLVDAKTGSNRLPLHEPEMTPPKRPSGVISLGINGVRVLPKGGAEDVYVYFDNPDAHLFCRVPLCLSTLSKTGPVDVLANLAARALSTDDFALHPVQGVAYLACQQNQLVRVPLARQDGCEGIICVTTNGGIQVPVNGTYTEGGKVLAFDTKEWR